MWFDPKPSNNGAIDDGKDSTASTSTLSRQDPMPPENDSQHDDLNDSLQDKSYFGNENVPFDEKCYGSDKELMEEDCILRLMRVLVLDKMMYVLTLTSLMFMLGHQLSNINGK